jgi:hypothetical protein
LAVNAVPAGFLAIRAFFAAGFAAADLVTLFAVLAMGSLSPYDIFLPPGLTG